MTDLSFTAWTGIGRGFSLDSAKIVRKRLAVTPVSDLGDDAKPIYEFYRALDDAIKFVEQEKREANLASQIHHYRNHGYV